MTYGEDNFGIEPPPLASRLKAWWNKKVESDSVRDFVPIYCTAGLIMALIFAFLLPPIGTLKNGLGGEVGYRFWVWATVLANLMPMIGLVMRHGGQPISQMSDRLLKRDWMGLYLQAAGHMLACLMLLLFQYGAWTGAVIYFRENYLFAGMTIFCAGMLTPWMLGTFLLFAQCMRKVQRGRLLALQKGGER